MGYQWDISRPLAEQLAETATDDAAADAMEVDGAILALRDATAEAGGNDELVEICNIALGNKPPPFGPGLETVELCRAECVRTIERGGADRGQTLPNGLRTQAEVDAFAEAMVDRAIADDHDPDGSDGAL